MSYSARILADSMSPDGVRLTTFEVVFPRFILAEFNTHRMLSRNSASSRAIPSEKLIQRVLDDPFIPATFNTRVKGMGVGAALVGADASAAEETWLNARDNAVGSAEGLMGLDCDKSRVNRLLEPFLWHTVIVSATEWDNFWGLRDHPAAQPEMQITARLMREVYDASFPQLMEHGWWHLPLLSADELSSLCAARDRGDSDLDTIVDSWKKVSASRCARVSFDKHTDTEPLADTIARAERLMNSVPAHLSPFEHVARPQQPSDLGPVQGVHFWGNFRGWVQMRREIPNEDNALRMIEAAVG